MIEGLLILAQELLFLKRSEFSAETVRIFTLAIIR